EYLAGVASLSSWFDAEVSERLPEPYGTFGADGVVGDLLPEPRRSLRNGWRGWLGDASLLGVVVDPLGLHRVEVAAEAELGAGALEGLRLGGGADDGVWPVTALAGAAAGDPVDTEAADDAAVAPGLELDL